MASVSDQSVALSLDGRIFELIVLPTEKCNFRCTYCYEDFAIGRMSEEVVLAVKRLIAARAPTLRWLTLSWFGGEPLLADSILLDIAQHAHELATRDGFVLSGGITTNGHRLTTKLVSDLWELNHRMYQITLDGYGAVHDASRKLANGRATFGRIWNNLLAIRDLGLELDIKLRVHVSAQNIASLPELLEHIDIEFAESKSFQIHFHRVSDLGGVGGKTVRELSWNEYGKVLRELTKNTRTGYTSEHHLDGDGYICYAAKPNSLLVRADGRIGKCTVALNDPRNHVGNLKADGTIEFFDSRLRLWFEGFRELDPRILGCPLPSLKSDPLHRESSQRIEAELIA